MNTEELIAAAGIKRDAAVAAAEAEYQRDVDAVRRAGGLADLPADGVPPVRLVMRYADRGIGRAVRSYLSTATGEFFTDDVAKAIGFGSTPIATYLQSHVRAGRVKVVRSDVGPKGRRANVYAVVRPASAATA
jgi:hypothetical protein